MLENSNENPNEIAELILEKHLQGKSYHFIKETVRFIDNIAITKCKLAVD
jgi:hypothetical protein